jgi:hypothetical protein
MTTPHCSVGRLERPQGRDRSEHLVIASFVCLARRKPAGSGHRVDQPAVKLVAPRSAECAQFVGFGLADDVYPYNTKRTLSNAPTAFSASSTSKMDIGLF